MGDLVVARVGKDSTVVSVELIPKSMEALNRAAELTGDSRSDCLNRAVQIYADLALQVSRGNKVFVGRSWWRVWSWVRLRMVWSGKGKAPAGWPPV